MEGICRGVWVVSPDFVMQSLAAGTLVDPQPYELAAIFPGARTSRRARDALEHAATTATRRYKCDVLAEHPRVGGSACVPEGARDADWR